MLQADPPPRRGWRRGDLPVVAIARLAGVSAPTVSKVLHGRAGVGEKTRRRVEALLRDHGYRQPTSIEPSRALAVVVSRILSSVVLEIMRGVEQVAIGHDMVPAFIDAWCTGSADEHWVRSVMRCRPRAVISLSAEITDDERARLAADGIPLVMLDPAVDIHSTPSVGSTNWSGAVDATRHVLDLGHRRVAVITGPCEILWSRARLDGFRAAMDTAGVPVDPELVRHGRFVFESGLELGVQLLGLPERPTAIVCGNDLQALGVYEAARRSGLRVPDDLSVVGFDDVEQCAWCAPPLTTVHQPFREMGVAATRLALALAAGESPRQSRLELVTDLVVRGSTAAPPRR